MPKQGQKAGGNRVTKMKVLAKMLLKQVKKVDGNEPLLTATTPPPIVPPKKPRKPRPPATGKALEWQQTFAQVRKQYPGKNSPEFQKALKEAGEAHKRKYAKSTGGQKALAKGIK